MADINQEIIDGCDHPIQERDNTYVSLRKVRWSTDGPVYYDLRKYRTQPSGEEMILKGVSFTEDGANELVTALTSEGLGDTKEIIDSIKDREDFNMSLVRSLSNDDIDLVKKNFPDIKLPEVEDKDDFYDIRKELS